MPEWRPIPENAISSFEISKKLDPNNLSTSKELASLHLTVGNLDKSVEIFNQIKISFISRGYKVAVIPSMRTPKKTIQLAKEKLINNAYIVSEVDKKAYLSSFAIANSIIVTCDSTSMISEAAVSGKPIFVAHMKTKRNNYRFKRFFQLFRDMGIIKNLGEKVEEWNYNNLNESKRIAELINQKINK